MTSTTTGQVSEFVGRRIRNAREILAASKSDAKMRDYLRAAGSTYAGTEDFAMLYAAFLGRALADMEELANAVEIEAESRA